MEEKPKRKTHTSNAVKLKYRAKAYDQVNINVPKGHRDKIKAAAEALGLSLNAYIVEAIKMRMGEPPTPIVEGAGGGSDVSDHP